MDPSNNEGPDGSSLKPVSSLRARFENMSKTENGSQPQQPPPRAISPAPKPDRFREASAAHKEPPAIPVKPKPRDLSASGLQPQHQPSHETSPRPSNKLGPPPPLSPRPIAPPPSLFVDPPQSPPKGRALNLATSDQSSLLNPDAVVKQPSPASSPRQFKIGSRPHTPVLEPRPSPRLTPSQPPSPPPPRRSVELRREREARAGPPVINRTDKPRLPSPASQVRESVSALESRAHLTEKRSPFSSPPDSPKSEEGEIPPSLPTRPRPRSQIEAVPRAKTIPAGFEPPPVHHSVASRRLERGQEANGLGKGFMQPQTTGEQRPPLPNRPQTISDAQPLTRSSTVSERPPPRPPRPGLVTSSSNIEDVASLQQKRVVSTPTPTSSASAHYPPPPTRTHVRATTMDNRPTPSRNANDIRQPSASNVVQPGEPRGGETPAAAAAKNDISMAYPDPSNVNRQPPYAKQGVPEISTKYDCRIFDVCGDVVCTSGHLTRAWSLKDGELLMSLAHGEGVKATSVAFKPGLNVDEEGKRVWIGNNVGDLMEADIATQSLTATRPTAHARHEVIKIYRHYNELWTLDDGGTLHVWGPDEEGTPNMTTGPHQTFRMPKGHMFSLVVGDELWHTTGKEIRVFLPTLDGKAQFQVLVRPLSHEGAGDVTAGTLLSSDPDKVFFGHADGKVTIYSRKDYACLGVVNVSSYKINSLAGVGRYMWAGFNIGRICVYDMSQQPWTVMKDWQAHDNPICKIIADRSSSYRLGRYQIVSLGSDSAVRVWDGLLQDDWLEGQMQAKDTSYCDFQTLKTLVFTWNAGASTPNSLRYSDGDADFFKNLLQGSGSPDILVFGFQELVDLEDKTATAKRFLKVKKKEGSDQERMSHQYRDWRDFLVRCLDDFMGGELYHLLQTAHMVGLFTCVFVKADIRDRVRSLSSAEVKRGMGGLHGNKGAIVVRFMVDDSSLCFINCHLAAGQSQANSRHNDVAAILEAAILPAERDPSARVDSYVGGGDGTMIMDHELCILNGDLNYRIDTMSRDTVVNAVKAGNLAKLLERDQLLVARRRNPAFRLRAFDEMPIAFAPTYKYDVGTDTYDSSEKRRSPAWCDRLLYRGPRRGGAGAAPRIQQVDYRRHEVRVSDHRPVTGRFKVTVKRVDAKRRAVAWMECQQGLEDLKEKESYEEK
ncbi:uncharacterized protein E0L32_008131 [Thyridium curvatum]|uniref:Inositol polyphosphate-related phosphatase domain-containing protein n=1 Tax=Thyridium curvatum TaxID=1093900 RepID=A0A507AKD0_9PEZI|nr:uncharacterized protein E0L32_008131 [Thyridium curvatum]TPX10925.1 hypothetical protein E0L32_008131 [Thyridium curvatum]